MNFPKESFWNLGQIGDEIKVQYKCIFIVDQVSISIKCHFTQFYNCSHSYVNIGISLHCFETFITLVFRSLQVYMRDVTRKLNLRFKIQVKLLLNLNIGKWCVFNLQCPNMLQVTKYTQLVRRFNAMENINSRT